MGYRRTPFAVGEWYHCYSRGVDGRETFPQDIDYRRFTEFLYLANGTKPIERNFFRGEAHEAVFLRERGEQYVVVGAYCLMSNHFHLLLQEKREEGITKFMHKLGTGYTMYFNAKHKRIGNLFVKPFRSKHIADDRYLKQVARYIHLNPAELHEPRWKEGIVGDFENLEKFLHRYQHASLPEFGGVASESRAERAILEESMITFLNEDLHISSKTLQESAEFYRELR